jgi:hypothetical protein
LGKNCASALNAVRNLVANFRLIELFEPCKSLKSVWALLEAAAEFSI